MEDLYAALTRYETFQMFESMAVSLSFNVRHAKKSMHCGRRNHVSESCYRLTQYKKKENSESQKGPKGRTFRGLGIVNDAEQETSCFSTSGKLKFIVDLVCSNHMICDKQYLSDALPTLRSITVASGRKIYATHIGTLKCKSMNSETTLVLNKVLVVANLDNLCF
jgi:hypothetical protein